MRVLCFGRFCDEWPGGIQSHVLSLMEGLRGVVEFVNLVPSRDFRGERFMLAGASVVRTPGWCVDGSLALSPGLAREAWRQCRAVPFDLVHLHFPDPMSHLASLFVPAGVPRVITWHADILRRRALFSLYRPWRDRFLRRAGAIIVATPAHLRAVPALAAVRERVRIIPYGFDLARFAAPGVEEAAAAVRAAFPGRLVFALGRQVAYKGFDVLLRAMARLGPETRLLLGGEGPLGGMLRRLAGHLGLGDRVVFLGRIPDARLPVFYRACDVFCLPSVSRAEAFGIAQVEAMAAGRPVVSTRLDNGVDFVNRDGVTGLSVPPGDVSALADALARLLAREDLRRAMGERAQQWAFSGFRREDMAARTLALYKEVLREAPGPVRAIDV